jgi:hypothetical protein
MAILEFYLLGEEYHIAVLDDSAVPRAGEIVNICKTEYVVHHVAWAVDHADEIFGTKLRAAIELELKI